MHDDASKQNDQKEGHDDRKNESRYSTTDRRMDRRRGEVRINMSY